MLALRYAAIVQGSLRLSADQAAALVAGRRRLLAALMSIHARRKAALMDMGLCVMSGGTVNPVNLAYCAAYVACARWS